MHCSRFALSSFLAAGLIGTLAVPAFSQQVASTGTTAPGATTDTRPQLVLPSTPPWVEPAPAPENTAPAKAPAAPAAVAQPVQTFSLAPELADRIARTEGKLSADEREDRAALKTFYEAHQQSPVWVTEKGFTAGAERLMAEIRKADDWGLEAADYKLPSLQGSDLSRTALADAEVTLSLAALKYAHDARGGRVDPARLTKYLDRKPQLYEPASVIEEVAKSQDPDAYLRGLHPKHPQFERLRQVYLALKRGEKVALAETAPPPPDKPSKKGKAATSTPKEPAQPTIKKILANMEEWRWMPDDLGKMYVWVNVPEYLVRVTKNGQVVHTERVVVGKPNTQTPIFSHAMEQVIFHPFWGVPDSIKTKELQPALAMGNPILQRQGLRVQYRGRDIDPGSVDWASVDMRNFHVYQPPGASNALGLVKFRFPNKHDVYMHDTPSKNLFNANVRAFSHGCMRVRNPQRLAEILLAEENWPAQRVASAMTGGPQDHQVNLSQKIPVHIMYFTAWVNDDGKLRMFNDIYGHETRIALGLEGKYNLIQQPREERAPSRQELMARYGGGGYGYKKNNWLSDLFGF